MNCHSEQCGVFILGRERELPQARAIDVHFIDPKALLRCLLPIEQQLLGIERKADSAENASSHRVVFCKQVGRMARPEVEDRNVPAIATASIDEVGIEMTRVVGLPLDEQESVKTELRA